MLVSSATISALDSLDLPLSVDLSELSRSDDPIVYTTAIDAQEAYKRLKTLIYRLEDIQNETSSNS